MRINRAFLALLPAAMLASGCSSPTATAPQVRTDKHAAYLKENASGYEWFANAADGYGGVPLVLLRSLPDLAPEIWGKPDEQFPELSAEDLKNAAAKPKVKTDTPDWRPGDAEAH